MRRRVRGAENWQAAIYRRAYREDPRREPGRGWGAGRQVVVPWKSPSAHGGAAVLCNLAPKGAVVRRGRCSRNAVSRLKARVFDSEDSAVEAILGQNCSGGNCDPYGAREVRMQEMLSPAWPAGD